MKQDIINGLFEGVGAFLAWMNAYRLYKVRIVRGVYWPITAFFAAWGFWNLYYYPSLNQWISFYSGVLLTLGNTAWVYMAIKWRHN